MKAMPSKTLQSNTARGQIYTLCMTPRNVIASMPVSIRKRWNHSQPEHPHCAPREGSLHGLSQGATVAEALESCQVRKART